MTNINNDKLVALANLFNPYLMFDPTERFFPANAEEWIDHQSKEQWTHTPSHQRGSAVLLVPLANPNVTAAEVVAGNDAPSGGPLQLDGSTPNGIGRPFSFDPLSQDLFIDCGGWDDSTTEVGPGDPAYTTGSIDYIGKLFSGQGNRLNSGISVEVPNPAPHFDFARTTAPTVYVEFEWGGRYPIVDRDRIAQTGGMPDFPSSLQNQPPTGSGTLTALNNYLVLNYYLFYPAMETSPVAAADPGANRIREGQWETISVYLRGDSDKSTVDEFGRPDFSFSVVPVDNGQRNEVRGLEPRFLVYSQGYGQGDDNYGPLAAEVRPWQDPLGRDSMRITAFHDTPVAWVTAGTHKNVFSIEATVNTSPSQPDPTLNTAGGATMGAAGTAAGVCLGLAPPPLTPACIVCLIIAGVVFIIGFILFLLSFILKSTPPPTESPQSSQPGTDVARDGGPQAVPATAPASVTGNGIAPSSTATTVLRYVSRFAFAGAPPPVTTYPLPAPDVMEMPSWWNFPGRWGVRVANRASSGWDSGSRRVDNHERSRGYWNAYQLVAFLGDSGRADDGITA